MLKFLKLQLSDETTIKVLKGIILFQTGFYCSMLAVQAHAYKVSERSALELYQMFRLLYDNVELEDNPQLQLAISEYIEFQKIVGTWPEFEDE